MPYRQRADPTLGVALEHSDLAESSTPSAATDMEHHLYGSSELTVQGGSVQSAEGGERLQSGRNLGRTVGVLRPGSAIVTRVESRQQVNALRTPDLPDNAAIGTHPQCLSNELTQRDFARPFDICATGDQPNKMRVVRRQLRGILDANNPFPVGDRT